MKNDKILTPGDVIYMLDRSTFDPNIPEERVRRMDIIEKDGGHYAHAKDGYYTIQFEVTGKCLNDFNNPKFKHLFATRGEAEVAYQRSVERTVNGILNTSKSKLLKQFYRDWCGESVLDTRVYKAMQDKIKKEFGVDVMSED